MGTAQKAARLLALARTRLSIAGVKSKESKVPDRDRSLEAHAGISGADDRPAFGAWSGVVFNRR